MERVSPTAIRARAAGSCRQGSNLMVVAVTSMLVQVVAGLYT